MNTRWIISLFAVFLFTGCIGQINESEKTSNSNTPPNRKPDDATDPSDSNNPSNPNDLNNPVEEEEEEKEACLSTEQFFMRKVWAQVALPTCIACHNGQGLASISNMLLNRELGFGDQLGPNINAMTSMATQKNDEHNNQSHLLLKATNTLLHGGGQAVTPGSPEFKILEEFVARIEQPDDCPTTPEPDLFENTIGHEPQDLFRKVAIAITGRLPTSEEMSTITNGGEPALHTALDNLLNEDGFYQRLMDGFNDVFFTDANIDTSSYNALDPTHFPNKLWQDELGLSDSERNKLRIKVRYGTGREPMELIAHIAKNDLPFTEILTANYIMVNPFSARSYGVEDKVIFNDPEDQYEFKPVTLPTASADKVEIQGPEHAHAGILNSYMFLYKHQSTTTNRNRARASFFFSTFLAIDILELAARSNNPLESVLEHENPTRDATACAICHVTMDPVAGAFQMHNNLGRYQPRRQGWYTDTFPPGTNGELLPDGQEWDALRWLAQKTAQDPRFALAMTEHVFFILTGERPMTLPRNPDAPDYESRLTVYATQREFLRKTAKTFAESNFNIKTAFKSVILSPYYRTIQINADVLTPTQTSELSGVGHAHPLQPEQLQRKIIAIFGDPWIATGREGFDAARYKYLYGGINSNTIIERLTEPNSVMAAVADLMANEVACANTARDFDRPRSQRLLFPDVEITDLPGATPQSDGQIKKNIQHLHNQILGKQLNIDDPEITRSFNLLKDVIADGLEDIKQERATIRPLSQCRTKDIITDPDYTVRGWMAVLTYLMSTYDFLYN